MNILIAHRNSHIRDWLQDAAHRAHEVTVAASEEVLLDELQSRRPFDFLIIQEGSDVIDGIKIVERLKKDDRHADLQIILLAESSEGIIKAVELGIVCMSMTRFSPSELMGIIRDLSPA